MKTKRSSLLSLLCWCLFTFIAVSTLQAQVKQSSSLLRDMAVKSPASWTRVAPETEQFAVMMPAAPRVQKEVRVIGGQELVLNYYGSTHQDSDYAVLAIVGFKDANASLAQMLMLDFYSRLNPATSQRQSTDPVSTIKATYQGDILLDGYSGRQFDLETNNRVGQWRIYNVGEKFYAVAASTTSKNSLSLNRFLDSFTLSNPQAIPATADAKISTGEPLSPRSTARWMIILKTFSKGERPRAMQRMSLLRIQGYDTRVVDTDSYPNLRPGFVALTMGPYSKPEAAEVLAKLRSIAPESYMKSGW